MGSVQLPLKAGYLRTGGVAAAPPALKGHFIPEGGMCGGPLPRRPLQPLGSEYSNVSHSMCPPPAPTSSGTVLEDVEWARTGWRAGWD